MANLTIPEDPQFSEEIFQLTPQTPAHANEFNTIHEKLFHNTLFLKLKSALLETEIAKAIAIALGRNQALVFNTYDEMVAWFENAENAEKVAALVNGTNLYIIDKNVPDYWWSSVNQQYYELETQKVDLTKYDNILGTNDISGLSEDGTVTGALVKQKQDVDEIYTNLANGEISFSVVDGEPYVKVGADSPRPFNSINSYILIYAATPHYSNTTMPTLTFTAEENGQILIDYGWYGYGLNVSTYKPTFKKNDVSIEPDLNVYKNNIPSNTFYFIKVKKGDVITFIPNKGTLNSSSYYCAVSSFLLI